MGKDKPGKCGWKHCQWPQSQLWALRNCPMYVAHWRLLLPGKETPYGKKCGQRQWVRLSCTEANTQPSLHPIRKDNPSNYSPKSSFTSHVPIPSTDSLKRLILKTRTHRHINFLPLSESSCKDLLDTGSGGLIWLLCSSKSFLWMHHSHKSWMSGHKRQCLCWYWKNTRYKTDHHQEVGEESDVAE